MSADFFFNLKQENEADVMFILPAGAAGPGGAGGAGTRRSALESAASTANAERRENLGNFRVVAGRTRNFLLAANFCQTLKTMTALAADKFINGHSSSPPVSFIPFYFRPGQSLQSRCAPPGVSVPPEWSIEPDREAENRWHKPRSSGQNHSYPEEKL